MPRGATLTSNTLAHDTMSLVSFIPDKFNFKMRTRASQTEKQGPSESQPPTNNPARFMYVQMFMYVQKCLTSTYLIGN